MKNCNLLLIETKQVEKKYFFLRCFKQKILLITFTKAYRKEVPNDLSELIWVQKLTQDATHFC